MTGGCHPDPRFPRGLGGILNDHAHVGPTVHSRGCRPTRDRPVSLGGGMRVVLMLGQQLRRTSTAEMSKGSGSSLRTRARRRKERTMTDFMRDAPGAPKIVDRSTFQAELDALRVREKAHTREGDAIAAARRRLPMVEIDSAIPLIGEGGPVTLLVGVDAVDLKHVSWRYPNRSW